MSEPDIGEDKTTPGAKRPRTGALEEGEVLANRYRLVRFVAAGGMGEVWVAEDLSLHEQVALKTLKPDAKDPALFERFRHEVKLARRVTHPNVCRIFEFGEHTRPEGEKVIFLTMELLTGRSLDEELGRSGPFTVERALLILEQLGAGLDAAHAQGIVHRDFKSPNVFLEGSVEHPRVVITDFGLARAMDADVRVTTNPQQMMGTPAYMAPEQVTGSEAGLKADVFALGVVAFEMVTAKLPFPADTALASALKRLSDPPLSARSLNANLPEHWDRVLFTAMSKRPEDRFASASQFVTALRAPALVPVVSTKPVTPPPLTQPPLKPKGRTLRWAAVALVAGFLVWKKVQTEHRQSPADSRRDLEAAVSLLTPAVQRCYEAQLAKTPGLEGQLELRVEVDKLGRNTHVNVERDTLGSPEVAACAMKELGSIEPTKPIAGAIVVYPFTFRPKPHVTGSPLLKMLNALDAGP